MNQSDKRWHKHAFSSMTATAGANVHADESYRTDQHWVSVRHWEKEGLSNLLASFQAGYGNRPPLKLGTYQVAGRPTAVRRCTVLLMLFPVFLFVWPATVTDHEDYCWPCNGAGAPSVCRLLLSRKFRARCKFVYWWLWNCWNSQDSLITLPHTPHWCCMLQPPTSLTFHFIHVRIRPSLYPTAVHHYWFSTELPIHMA